MARHLCCRPTPTPLSRTGCRRPGSPAGVQPGSGAVSLRAVAGAGPSDGAVLENWPQAKLHIQAYPSYHSHLVTERERVWSHHLPRSTPPRPCPGSGPEFPLCINHKAVFLGVQTGVKGSTDTSVRIAESRKGPSRGSVCALCPQPPPLSSLGCRLPPLCTPVGSVRVPVPTEHPALRARARGQLSPAGPRFRR